MSPLREIEKESEKINEKVLYILRSGDVVIFRNFIEPRRNALLVSRLFVELDRTIVSIVFYSARVPLVALYHRTRHKSSSKFFKSIVRVTRTIALRPTIRLYSDVRSQAEAKKRNTIA